MPANIHFRSGNSTLSGHLYIPEEFSAGSRLPAVVTVAPGSGIKEQTAGRYARELCDRGFVTLSFDHRTYGESEGFPRYDEDPYSKIEDVKNAVGYLAARAEVDPRRIGIMGVCGGGGYAPAAAATDRRVRAVAAVSGMFDHRTALQASFPDHDSIIATLESASQPGRSTPTAESRHTYRSSPRRTTPPRWNCSGRPPATTSTTPGDGIRTGRTKCSAGRWRSR